MDTNTIIETRNLTKQYGPQKSVADLSIHVKRGRIYGLLGRNGARPARCGSGEILCRGMKRRSCPASAA